MSIAFHTNLGPWGINFNSPGDIWSLVKEGGIKYDSNDILVANGNFHV